LKKNHATFFDTAVLWHADGHIIRCEHLQLERHILAESSKKKSNFKKLLYPKCFKKYRQ
jgi:hypothetical protein